MVNGAIGASFPTVRFLVAEARSVGPDIATIRRRHPVEVTASESERKSDFADKNFAKKVKKIFWSILMN